MRVPPGVVAIIYESRPNVPPMRALVASSAGNACIPAGGSEALASHRAIAECVRAGLAEAAPRCRVQRIDAPTAPPWASYHHDASMSTSSCRARERADRAPVARGAHP